jgi:hypothetical protein
MSSLPAMLLRVGDAEIFEENFGENDRNRPIRPYYRLTTFALRALFPIVRKSTRLSLFTGRQPHNYLKLLCFQLFSSFNGWF